MRKDLKEYAAEIVTQAEAVELAGQMEGLASSQAFQSLLELLVRARQQVRESFEAADDMGEIQFLKGLIAGLNYAGSIPTVIVQRATETKRRDEARGSFREDLGGGSSDPSF